MDLYAVLDQVVALLRQRQRVTYRALKVQFQLDDEALEALRDELIEAQRLAADEAGRVLIWTGNAGSSPAPAPEEAYALRLLGEIAAHRNPPDVDTAAAHYRHALTLDAELGMRPLQAHCHRSLGTLYAATGQRDPARHALVTAISLYRSISRGRGHPARTAGASLYGGRPRGAHLPYWQRAGEHAIERSAYWEALSHLSTGLEVLSTLPDTSERTCQELLLQMTLGPVLAAIKGYASLEVEHTYARARTLCHQVGDTLQFFPVLRGLWWFYLLRGELQTARELGEQLLSQG